MRTKSDLQAAIRQRRRAVLLVNARSRRGARLHLAAGRQLEAAGFDLLGSFAVSRPGQLENSLAAALDLEPDLLVAGGGDGTLSLAARHLAYRDVALGIVPLGTTNNFARTLGVPLSVAGAVGLLTRGKVTDVDLGQVNGTFFANLVSVGLSGHVAATVRHDLKRLLGRAAYPLTALARLPRHRPFRAVITVGGAGGAGGAGGHERVITTHQLNIANGSFHGGRPITGDASADDRLLLAYSLGGGSRPALIGATTRHVLTGGRRTHAEPAFLATRDLWLHTEPPLPLDIDGEIQGETPARITLAPNALRVIVDPGFPDA
ncbi:MAG TPA: diacylglycerol kinase family protein [Streptosporangiaceae bacterium]|nr:diacylglycerol kinase family protein [Streptosporangiaceae bacterium]